MKTSIIFVAILLLCQLAGGQEKYMTEEGMIRFYSHTIIEDITAVNNKVAVLIDGEQGAVAIVVPMNEFQFEKKLMQEHFNENYVESHRYPKATFSGKIENNSQVNYQQAGSYQVRVKGEMTIHGVSRDITVKGIIEIRQDGLRANTEFLLNPGDYDIKIPRVVRRNIAEKMEITAELLCPPV